MGDKSEGVCRDFYVPDYLLVPRSKPWRITHVSACPVSVFINSKSGGQLLVTYRSLLNKNQVFDLGESAPNKVLHQFYVTLEVLKNNGDDFADEVQKKLRINYGVAGGDGTASWLLGVISDLRLPKPPPVATVPLGAGNNLPFSFGWYSNIPNHAAKGALVYRELRLMLNPIPTRLNTVRHMTTPLTTVTGAVYNLS
ncbi:hypothetical protein CDL15_Pgr028847 [Punica granatum]|uniref:DAGKc domain-containing protein n=1 Tax=Punica granatum TaxID=22663 RepID=A0A218WXU6_PUNGR|nr:hypothetical protein CDL15_Pgr028847 [Punica granatum]